MPFKDIPARTKFINPEIKNFSPVYIKLENMLPSGSATVLLRMVDGQAFDFVNCVEEKTGRTTRVNENNLYERIE